MRQDHDTELKGLMEQIILNGTEDMASVFAGLFDLAMCMEREQFLEAGHYERSAGRRGYANGYKTKKLDTPAGTLTLNVPKRQAFWKSAERRFILNRWSGDAGLPGP